MFSSLESNWDQSARRGRATLASFTMQALGLSLLLAIPLFTIQGPPVIKWFDESQILVPPSAPPPPASPERQGQIRPSNFHEGILQTPPSVPPTIAQLNEGGVEDAPDVGNVGVIGSTGNNRRGVWGSTGGPTVEVAPPPKPPTPTHPLQISHWSEGNLVFRVQPVYPALARQARIQGAVELRAIISKTGTIENLTVVNGHPMLVRSAIEAVRQWRYRPYMLNGEPVEVETDVTVNFLLSGG